MIIRNVTVSVTILHFHRIKEARGDQEGIGKKSSRTNNVKIGPFSRGVACILKQ